MQAWRIHVADFRKKKVAAEAAYVVAELADFQCGARVPQGMPAIVALR